MYSHDMAAVLAGCRTALVGTGWTIVQFVSTNSAETTSLPLVGALFWICRKFSDR